MDRLTAENPPADIDDLIYDRPDLTSAEAADLAMVRQGRARLVPDPFDPAVPDKVMMNRDLDAAGALVWENHRRALAARIRRMRQGNRRQARQMKPAVDYAKALVREGYKKDAAASAAAMEHDVSFDRVRDLIKGFR